MAENIPRIKTFSSMLKYWANNDPESPAFVFEGDKEKVFSRKDIYVKAGKWASILKRVGANKGDVIVTSIYNGINCPDRVICELGIQIAGCVSIEVFGIFSNGQDLQEQLLQCGARMIITDEKSTLLATTEYKSSVKTQYGLDIMCPELPNMKHVILIPTVDGDSLEDLAIREDNIFMETVNPLDTSVILLTSGTTSSVKMVVQNQQFFLNNGDILSRSLGDLTNLQNYNDSSMNWITGYPNFYVATGITRVMRNHLDQHLAVPLDIFEKNNKYAAYLSTEEVHDIYLANKAKKTPNIILQTLVMGGLPLKKSIIKEALTFSKTVINMYGSTETGILAYLTIKNADDYADYCVGSEVPDVELKILDKDGQEVPPGKMGTIQVRKPFITSGQLEADGVLSREKYTDDGWFKTGDIGFRDETGKIYVTGRGGDVIARGDAFVYPHHMEKDLSACPAVEDVVVVGVPDPVLYQEVCVIIKGAAGFKDPVSDVQTFFEKTFVSHIKEYAVKPKYFLECESILRNKNGKVERKKLAEMARRKLKL